MNKIIVIIGVLLTTSCGTFSKMTEQEKELNYQIDKAYFEYTIISFPKKEAVAPNMINTNENPNEK